MIQSIVNGREEDGNRSIAHNIIKRLDELDQTSDNNQGRWAWELLQNAKDSIAEDNERTVSVQIQLDENTVEFRHNGAHFTEQDVRGLINQISSKEIEEGQQTQKTGRFGTGFLTTHLLSRVIQIKGIVQTADDKFYKFDFPLDRQGKTTTQLIPKINNSFQKFQESVKEIGAKYDKDEFNTSFCYQLEKEKQKKVAKIGVEEFAKLIPFVLAFIPRIIRVEIIDNTTNNITIFEKNQELIDGFVVPISKNKNKKKTNIFILYASDDKVKIATEIEETERGYSVKSIENFPKLFCDFPLIGSEDFHFPVIVNSFFFNPQTERNGLWLKDSDNTEVKENQKLLENAVELYKNLISKVSEGHFFDLYNLAETKMPSTNEIYFNENWYKDFIQKPIREFIYKAKVVETENDKVLLGDVYFPDPNLNEEDREKIWKFSSDLKINKLPSKQHIHKWAKLIWKDCKRVDIAELVANIQAKANITELINTLEIDDKESFVWLNNCIEFIYEIGGQNYFDNNTLIPNQEGAFKKRKELSIDEIEDETLKQIAYLVGYNYYKGLIHKDIYFEYSYTTTTMQNVANEIIKNLIKDDDNNDKNRMLAIIKLTEWFESNPDPGKKLFTELYRKKEKLLVDTIEDKENLYRVLKSKIPLSKLASPELSEEIQKAEELTNLLKDFGANDVSDLRKKLELAQNISTNNSKIQITEQTLVSLGVKSLKELEEALKDNDFASQFIHTSTPTEEMFIYAQGLISRAKTNVIEYLKKHPKYACEEWQELAPTVIGGIKKDGLPIYVVVRPSDNREVIVYYSSEKDILDNPYAELWIDNGVDEPRHLTLGKILKITGINRIPV
ncbi:MULTISPECIES: sacsin N-terminal ATP-binding-like domain-containing protein [unclassified Microcoleus]|uniref:sacsin N-terminal ATP-binding-like domain-containing protein n=1 Tax=unclassified Microcoleus TaxID=2642155 RepID=UPI002FCF6E57